MITGQLHQICTKRLCAGETPHVLRFILGVLLVAVVIRFTIFLIHWMGG